MDIATDDDGRLCSLTGTAQQKVGGGTTLLPARRAEAVGSSRWKAKPRAAWASSERLGGLFQLVGWRCRTQRLGCGRGVEWPAFDNSTEALVDDHARPPILKSPVAVAAARPVVLVASEKAAASALPCLLCPFTHAASFVRAGMARALSSRRDSP